MKKSLELLLFKPISSGATYLIKNETIKSALTLFCIGWITVRGLYLINGIHVKAWQSIHISYLDVNVNIRMYNFDDVQCTVIPSVAYGFVTGMNLQLC